MRIPDHLRPPLIEQLEDQADSGDCLVMRGSALGHALLGNNDERDFFIKKFIEAEEPPVEGNELAVLKGLDFNKYRPKWILVETRDNKVKEYLEKNNYDQKNVLSKYPNYSDVLFKRCDL